MVSGFRSADGTGVMFELCSVIHILQRPRSLMKTTTPVNSALLHKSAHFASKLARDQFDHLKIHDKGH